MEDPTPNGGTEADFGIVPMDCACRGELALGDLTSERGDCMSITWCLAPDVGGNDTDPGGNDTDPGGSVTEPESECPQSAELLCCASYVNEEG